MPGLDAEDIRRALTLARDAGITEVTLESDGERFEAVFGHHRPAAPADTPDQPTTPAEALTAVTSPAVGYFRPDTDLYQLSGQVEKGQVIGSIVALGLANDVVAPASGTLAEILAEADQPLVFGAVIARLRPNP